MIKDKEVVEVVEETIEEPKKLYEVSHKHKHPVTPFDKVYLENKSHIDERHGVVE